MKKLLLGTLLLILLAIPVSSMAEVTVHVGIPMPPAIVFHAPPVTVVIPNTYVYAVPDAPEDIFFYGGWWWRPWQGRWYRSRHYDAGWAYYKGRPPFHGKIPPRWRDDYRDHRWGGHQWDHRPVPYHELEKNWRGWEHNKHWEKQHNWGVHRQGPSDQPQYHRSFQQKHDPPPREVNHFPKGGPEPKEKHHPKKGPEPWDKHKPHNGPDQGDSSGHGHGPR